MISFQFSFKYACRGESLNTDQITLFQEPRESEFIIIRYSFHLEILSKRKAWPSQYNVLHTIEFYYQSLF